MTRRATCPANFFITKKLAYPRRILLFYFLPEKSFAEFPYFRTISQSFYPPLLYGCCSNGKTLPGEVPGSVELAGDPPGTRTRNPLIKSQMLYQLS